jgi:type IV pilus assembly protein PilM
MAKTGCVWGIDIGQCAIKALKCQRHDDDPNRLTAEAFDYIEYPKILSQPEADPAELVREALETFLSRNEIRGDKIAISVSGQSGLARFIKLPPVESKKIPDIVKYEARQQIPFPLDDVIWDYQQMAGGSIEEGFALETEVGLFAMKRDQVWRALKPFEEAGIEVDLIQLAPLAIYNFTAFDQMPDLPPVESYNPEEPPESVVVISLGTETTDLVITNGFRVWQRSLPLGGSHFTKALSKELRLTFAKAEHLKRNAKEAEDPKAVFTAMRPVFNELATEVQRSIAFFGQVDRNAKIGRVIALGNAMRLPGLQTFLVKNLGYPVVEVDRYHQLSGGAVTGAPAFRENLLSFAVSYGLAIQGLNRGKIETNLIPRELLTERLIREKKPWAVGTLAMLLLGCTISYLSHWAAWSSVHPTKFASVFGEADGVQSAASGYVSSFETAKAKYEEVDSIGKAVVGNVDNRLLWPELLKAINECLPHDPDPANRPADIADRKEIHIEELDMEKFVDVSSWYGGVRDRIQEAKQGVIREDDGEPGEQPATDAAAAPVADAAPAAPPEAGGDAGVDIEALAEAVDGPSGEGWVIQIKGYHFHNKRLDNQAGKFVHDTFIKNLEEKQIRLPDGPDGKMKLVSMKELGISNPVIVRSWRVRPVEIRDPNAPDLEQLNEASGAGFAGGLPTGGVGRGNAPEPEVRTIKLQQFDFIMQFCWQETPLTKRLNPEPKTEDGAGDETLAAAGSE